MVERGVSGGFAAAANAGFAAVARGLRGGRAHQHRRRLGARLAGADRRGVGGRTRRGCGGVQDGGDGRSGAHRRRGRHAAARRRLRAARARAPRRRALRRARRGLGRVRGRGAVPAARDRRRRGLRRVLRHVLGGRRPRAAPAAGGVDVPLRAGRGAPRRRRSGAAVGFFVARNTLVLVVRWFPVALGAVRGLPAGVVAGGRSAPRAGRARRAPARAGRRGAAASVARGGRGRARAGRSGRRWSARCRHGRGAGRRPAAIPRRRSDGGRDLAAAGAIGRLLSRLRARVAAAARRPGAAQHGVRGDRLPRRDSVRTTRG